MSWSGKARPVRRWATSSRPHDAFRGSSEAHLELGKALLGLGKVTDALPHLETAVRLDPTLAEARIDLGVAQARAGRLDEALATFQAAVEQVPDDIDARRNLAYTLLVMGRRDQAAFHYREILRRDPGNGEALHAVASLAAGEACREGAGQVSLTTWHRYHGQVQRY